MSSTATSRREFLLPSFTAADGDCVPTDPAPPPSREFHIANRLMYGPRPGDLATLAGRSYEDWLEEQLNPAAIDDSDCEARIAALNLGTLEETPAQLYDRRNAPWPIPIQPRYDVETATWTRQLHSQRQLYEKMVQFWMEHFSIFGSQYIVRSLFPMWDADVRTHAMGNFRALLGATARNPCMLYYLDNYANTNAGPNENYARELFELHTLGAMHYRPDIVDQVTCNSENDADGDGLRDYYIDNDVYEAARCFTGWTFYSDENDPNRGQFRYDGARHDRFNKFVLCQYFPNDAAAMQDGEDTLDLLARHPATARHIAWKLCRRFVSEDPPADLVESTAQVFEANWEQPDQIAITLRHLLTSDSFHGAAGQKFKRPQEWAVSAMRALGLPYINTDNFNLAWIYSGLGHVPFEWRSPEGPPEEQAYWASSNGLLRRWNFIFTTASWWWHEAGFTYQHEGIMPPELRTPEEIVSFWIDHLHGRPVSGATREGLLRFLAEGRNHDLPLPQSQIDGKIRFLAGLITMTPEFQRH